MKETKRLCSAILILSFLMSMLIIPAKAESSIGENDILIADFANDANAISSFKFTKDTETTYDGAPMSAKWLTSGRLDNGPSGVMYFNADKSAVDLNGMESVHIVMNNEKSVGNKMNILFYYVGKENSYFQTQISLDWEGWKEISIPLKDFGAKNGCSWDSITQFTFNQGGWGGTLTEHSPVYFDSIWLESKAVPDEIEIADAAKLVKESKVFTADTTYNRLYSETARWSGEKLELVIDAGDYFLPSQKSLCQWIYSPEKTNEEIEIKLVSSGDSSYVSQSFSVDWTGWKPVVFDTSNFSGSGKLSNADMYVIEAASSKLYFDRIWFSSKGYPTISGSDLYASGGVVPAKNATILLELTEGIQGSSKSAISIKSGDDEVADFSVTDISDTIKYITIPELTGGEEYTISIKEGTLSKSGKEFVDIIPIEFTAAEVKSYSGNITFKGSTSKLTANATVEAESTDELTLVAATYKSGKLSGIVEISGEGALTTPTFKAGSATKAWVISKKYGVIKTASRPERYEDILAIPADGIKESFALNGVYQEKEGFGVDISYQGPERKAVAVIYNSDGAVFAAEEFFVASDVLHSISIDNATITAGVYKAEIYLLGGDEIYTYDVHCLSADDETAVISSINSAETEDDVYDILTANKSLFRISDVGDEKLLEHIALVVFESTEYSSFDDVHKIIDYAREALDELNACDWTELDAWLSGCPEALADSEAYDTLNSLSTGEKPIILKAVGTAKPFNSFVEFRSSIIDAVEEYRSTGKVAGNVPSRVNGNNDSSGREYKVEYDNDKSPNEFTDLEAAMWAKDSIYALLEKGIITMPDDGLYRPLDNITRAEFVTLLVKAMGLDISDKSSVFTDVDERDWYAPYFTAAKAVGIVSGYDDGTVGALETIKRQDIAVMVIRALDALGIEFTKVNENVNLKDSDSISDYATEAVTLVMEYGIMSGMGDGEFAPLGITGRAQAAVVIERMMTGIENGGSINAEVDSTEAAEIEEMPEFILLKNIGIIPENDTVISRKAVTRRELARVLYNIERAGNDTESLFDSITFTDVQANDPDLTAIAAAASLGYMTAKNGEFKPDEAIDNYELFTALVKLLGYDFMADYSGGYPVGYIKTASNLGLVKNTNLDSAKTINNIEFVNAVFNMLNAAPAEFSGVTDNSFVGYSVNPENTFLYKKYGIYELEGVLEGDMYSDILNKIPRADKGDIIIAGKLFKTSLDNLNSLVGHMTKSYIREDDQEALAVFSYETEETKIINSNVTIDDNSINYELSDGTKKSIDYSKTVSIMYNGRLVAFDKKLFENVNGYISVIDYDEDNKSDVIKIYNYTVMQVNNVSVESGIITDSLGGRSINIGKQTDGEDYLIYKNGKRASVQDLKREDIISYYILSQPELTVINATDESVTGVCVGVDDDVATIGEKEYYVLSDTKSRISTGTEMKFHFDFLGRVASCSTTLDMVYGYLHRIYQDEETMKVYMKIFTENNRWVELPLLDRVKLNDTKVDAEEVYSYFGQDPVTYRQLIRYNVTDDAMICKVFTAKEYKSWSDEEREAMLKDEFRYFERAVNVKFHGNNKSFGNTMVVSGNTKVFLVPAPDAEASTEDYYVISSSVFIDNKSYKEVISYDVNETFVADALVVKDSVENVYAVSNQQNISPLMVVTKVRKTLNQDEELSWFVEGAFNGAEKFGIGTKNLTDLPDVEKLIKGDVIQPAMDRDGNLIAFEHIYKAENGFKQFITSQSPYVNYVVLAGEVLSVDPDANRMVIKTNATDKGLAVTLDGSLKPMIYDSVEGEAKNATKHDILKGDRIVLMSRYLVARQMVIFR